MIVKKNRIKIISALLVCGYLIMIPPPQLQASGITIIKNQNRTELLIPETNGERTGIELELSGEGLINLENGGQKTLLRFSAGNRPEKIYIYRSLAGFFPEKIIIAGTGGWDLLSAGLIHYDEENGTKPADIGHIIYSEFNLRGPHPWNVYSWNLAPEVLIYDTGDYSVQSRLFKRLAFFVEKPGFVGRLVSNEELEGKHGWNAHDYKAEDLAAFFNTADETGFVLNEEELLLREQLLNHGIIKSAGESLTAGTGAVLSVSRETEASWRYRFLTHECLHGLFFTDSSFKSDIYEVFARLQPEEVEFWRRLLDYRRYDTGNSYLMINEFMAYSLQQPAAEIDEYFKGFLYVRMIAARPWEEVFITGFDKNFPDSFKSSVLKLEKVLYNHTGRIAGHLANIYPAGVDDSFFNLFPPL